MAGIYIHIPFCKQRCTYCDFYTQVAPHLIPDLVDAIVKELHLRKDYLKNAAIETIYFGGGTPSVLSFSQFDSIFRAINELFEVNEDAEITFEANPDDLTPEFLSSISPLPFNRVSIGIQSFDDEDLKRVNRRHSGLQAINAVKACQAHGFENISVDLIYGLPSQSLEAWNKQLDIAFNLHVQHISVYGLTYEEGTRLWKQREMGKVNVVADDEMISMYEVLLAKMKENGFEAYEISNFSLPGYRSRHNSAYWQINPYLGIGPSAHSFDGTSRQWNISSNKKFINALNTGENFFEKEELSQNDRYNDYVMVSLRTTEGISLKYIEENFGVNFVNYCIMNAEKFIQSNKLKFDNNKIYLSYKGIQISNMIISELMHV